jgi:hypothetical protein
VVSGVSVTNLNAVVVYAVAIDKQINVHDRAITKVSRLDPSNLTKDQDWHMTRIHR